MLYKAFSFLLIILLFCAGCATSEPTMTPTAVAVLVDTAVSPTTPTPSHTPQPTSTTTQTPTPSVTPIPLPLDPMAPFPTVTPNYTEYETKPIFLSLVGWGGDGGTETDNVEGRSTPSLIIYADGQVVFGGGGFGTPSIEAFLTPEEMCQLRQQIADTGFLEPHHTFFTQYVESMGGGFWSIRVDNTFYNFYSGNVGFLVEDLASGYQLIRDYRPPAPYTTYIPNYLVLWLEETQLEDGETATEWPSELPPLSELWVNREEPTITIDGDLVPQIFEVFDNKNSYGAFQEDDTTYFIIARPILPHETPRHYPVIPFYPLDYVPVLNCEGEPSFISLIEPTATPTLTAPVTKLSGQGRIAFTTGIDGNEEIFVMDIDGTNRLRLTNDLVADSEPTWSPDGQYIAFTSERSGNQDIFVMNSDGTDVKQLTTHKSADYSPSWSPDGSKIVFVSDRTEGWDKSEIYMMNKDGSGQVRLTDNAIRDLYPVWSPDGHKIVFIQELDFNTLSTLAILNLDELGAAEEQLSYTADYVLSFKPRIAWSPDSTTIAIPLKSTIHFINLITEESQSYDTNLLDYPSSLSWSATGDYIVFSAQEPSGGENAIYYTENYYLEGSWNLYTLDLATEEIIQLTFTQKDEHNPNVWP